MPSLTLPSSLWETVKCDFKGLFPEDVFQMWFEPVVCLETTEDSIALGVPNDFAAIWIHDNYLDLITQRLRLTAGRLINVSLKVHHPGPAAKPTPGSLAAGNGTHDPLSAPAHHNRVRATPRRSGRYDEKSPNAGTLNPRNTFENFVVGANNQLAHAAAKVAYLSTEKFTNEFIQALQENSLTRFRQRYRNVDVLLLDDVQFLSNKERIQEEFFHTFNDVFESGKQVVLSSDRPASEIAKLESRLVSRFQWGYVADIQSPDLETRVAILRTKAASLKFDVPPAVINFIAQHISKNIRRLEGALIKVASYSALTNKALDLPTVEMLLQDVLMEQAQNLLTLETIQKRVADHYQIRHSDMTSKRRPANIALPRQIAMYLARQLTKHSLQEIGDAFGGRDHGTVIHACKTVENMMEQDDAVRGSVEFLKAQLSK